MRESADAAVCAVERVGGSAGHDYRQFGGGMGTAAEAGSHTSTAVLISGVVVVGSGVCQVRLDAISGGAAGMGIFRLAEGTQEENHAKGQELVQPEGPNVRIGSGIRADSAVVAACRTAIGENAGGADALSRIAVRSFVDCDFDRGGGFVPEGGNARFAAGTRESIDGRKSGDIDAISDVNAVGLGENMKCV